MPVRILSPINEPNVRTPEERPNPYTITEDILRERLKRKHRGRYITQLCVAISASLGALSFGIDLGWSSPATRYLINGTSMLVNMTGEEYAWVGSLMPLGCTVGIIPWHYSMASIGPKHTLILQMPLYMLTLLVTFSVKTKDIFLAGRFFNGLFCISSLLSGECLLMDCVHRGNLGHMLVLFRSSIFLGVFISYTIGYVFPIFWVFILRALIPTGNVALLIFIPESPVFLYNKSELKAAKSLIWYRGPTNITLEMRSIQKNAELRKMEVESSNYMLYSKVVVKALFIILGLIFFQVFSGYYAFIFYAYLIWAEGSVTKHPLIEIAIFGLFLYFGDMTANMLHNHIQFGVRKPLVISTSSIAVILSILTFHAILKEKKVLLAGELDWLPFVMANALVVCYEMGLGVYADMLLFDYLPFQVHKTAKMIAQVWFWFQVFILTNYFMTARALLSTSASFGILAVFAYGGIAFCYFFIIETKDKNLLQIQLEIGGNPIGNRGAFAYRHRDAKILTTF